MFVPANDPGAHWTREAGKVNALRGTETTDQGTVFPASAMVSGERVPVLDRSIPVDRGNFTTRYGTGLGAIRSMDVSRPTYVGEVVSHRLTSPFAFRRAGVSIPSGGRRKMPIEVGSRVANSGLGTDKSPLDAPVAVDYPSFYAQLAYFDTAGDSAPVVDCAKKAQAQKIPFSLKPGSALNLFLDACGGNPIDAKCPAGTEPFASGGSSPPTCKPICMLPLVRSPAGDCVPQASAWYLQPKFLFAGGAVALVLAGLGIYALTRQS